MNWELKPLYIRIERLEENLEALTKRIHDHLNDVPSYVHILRDNQGNPIVKRNDI